MPVRSAGRRARANPEIAVELDSQLDQGGIAQSDARSRRARNRRPGFRRRDYSAPNGQSGLRRLKIFLFERGILKLPILSCILCVRDLCVSPSTVANA